MTFYVHQQYHLAVPHAVGASTAGNTIYSLNPGFTSNYEIQIESSVDLDSIDDQCSSNSEYLYPQVRITDTVHTGYSAI